VAISYGNGIDGMTIHTHSKCVITLGDKNYRNGTWRSAFTNIPDKGCPDLLSERDVDGDDGDEDNSSVAVNSPANPYCQCNSSQPFGYSQRHMLAHVAADHEAVMQYTNSQWNSRLHSDFQ
jgi:hypothetical protein